MATSILLKLLTLKWDISRTIWRIEVIDGALRSLMAHFFFHFSLSISCTTSIDFNFLALHLLADRRKLWLFQLSLTNYIYIYIYKGVRHSTQFGKSISNYFSHIKSGTRDCEISCHFIDCHQDTWISDYRYNTDFQLIGIAQLQNPPRNKKDLEQRLRDFEGYWKVELGTVQPHGLNFRNELKESFFKHSK